MDNIKSSEEIKVESVDAMNCSSDVVIGGHEVNAFSTFDISKSGNFEGVTGTHSSTIINADTFFHTFQPPPHSVSIDMSTEARKYRISLGQARRMALRAIKKAKKRQVNSTLKDEDDI